jgi:uncharacterized protein (DUF488 family)
MPEEIYTIGHSTHTVERLVQLLKQHGITAVCDVRSQPYSRMNPQFNREPLRDALRAEGVRYVFLGKELGARSDDKSCYRNGQVQYDRLACTDSFKRGLERVREGSQSYRVALMCAERDPLHCHRTILVARHLVGQGVHVRHILANGQIEEHEQALNRLLTNLKLAQDDMFRSNTEIAAEAYRTQAETIAYREKSEDTSTLERRHAAPPV